MCARWQYSNFFKFLLEEIRSHLYTKNLLCVVYGLDVQVIFPLLCNKLRTDAQNWNKSCYNLGKGGMLAGWEQHCSQTRMIISQGWNGYKECYKVKQAEQSEMLIRKGLKKKLGTFGFEAIFLFSLLQIKAWLLGSRVLFLFPICDTSI